MKMLQLNVLFLMIVFFSIVPLFQSNSFEKDIIDLGGKKLSITFIGHATLMMEYEGLIIHIDPVSEYADYSVLPKGDIILITHKHGDHLDKNAVKKILKSNTVIVGNKDVKAVIGNAKAMQNGDVITVKGIKITAVPAYNITEGRDKFHPKGRDNGYILVLNNRKVYIAGDTENTPELLSLRNIEIAFLPMNQPYTMTVKQVAEVIKTVKPKIVYPYHFSDTDTSKLISLTKNIKDVEVRIRNLK